MFQIPFSNKQILNAMRSLIENGKYQSAIFELKDLTKQFPNSHDLHELLGIAYARVNDAKMADMSLSIAWNNRTKSADLFIEYGWNKFRLGQYKAAISCFELALNSGVIRCEILVGFINALTMSGKEEAIPDLLQQLSDMADGDADALMHLGGFYLERGLKQQARTAFEKALSDNPLDTTALDGYAQACGYQVDDAFVAKLKSYLSRSELDGHDKVQLGKTLATIYEKSANYKAAFENYDLANKSHKSLTKYNFKTDETLFEAIKAKFQMLQNGNVDNQDDSISEVTPVFVIGMMRSGTSLIEQMLDSHPEIQGLGELEVARRWYDDHLAFANRKDKVSNALPLLQRAFAQQVQQIGVSQSMFVDKMPTNFRFVGFLARAFPKAKFIHLKRSPQAVIWSNFKMYLNHNYYGFINDLDDLTNYYHLYLDLMRYWERTFGDHILSVNYEELVANPEDEVKKLLSFLGKDFEPNCLAFEKNKRVVRTTSSTQVKRGLYANSSEQWRHYESYLPEAMLALRNDIS